jgi:hypothetical protein
MTDSVSQRFSKLLKQINHNELALQEASVMKELAANFNARNDRGEPDFDNVPFREALANAFLTLYPANKSDAPLAKAFTKAALDPKNPFHWRLLMNLFCLAHFGRGRGRGKEWDSTRYMKFLRDFEKVKAEKPAFNKSEVCRLLKKRHPGTYGKLSIHRLGNS